MERKGVTSRRNICRRRIRMMAMAMMIRFTILMKGASRRRKRGRHRCEVAPILAIMVVDQEKSLSHLSSYTSTRQQVEKPAYNSGRGSNIVEVDNHLFHDDLTAKRACAYRSRSNEEINDGNGIRGIILTFASPSLTMCYGVVRLRACVHHLSQLCSAALHMVVGGSTNILSLATTPFSLHWMFVTCPTSVA
jgi:hypothetical protein